LFDTREFFGPGWRMYDVRCGEVLVLMLGGGDKSTQQADIAAAQLLAASTGSPASAWRRLRLK
jgi:putative addiction module killer protein